MCTVTYLPKLSEDGSFILTSSRDESPKRPAAVFPAFKKYMNRNIIFPQDPEAGGTWMAMSDDGVLVVLMNGAFEAHEHKPPYRMSRGLVVLEMMECIKPDEFIKNYDFDGIEPFTVLVMHYNPNLEFLEFRWDGQKKHITSIDPSKPHIWSSASLYNKEQTALREKWFARWLNENPDAQIKKIRQFHHEAGEGDKQTNVKMDRGLVKTVSITSAIMDRTSSDFIYEKINEKGEQHIRISQEIDLELSN